MIHYTSGTFLVEPICGYQRLSHFIILQAIGGFPTTPTFLDQPDINNFLELWHMLGYITRVLPCRQLAVSCVAVMYTTSKKKGDVGGNRRKCYKAAFQRNEEGKNTGSTW